MIEQAPSWRRLLSTTLVVGWFAYWVALAFLTHLPRIPQSLPAFHYSDVVAHFIAYFLLSLGFRIVCWLGPFRLTPAAAYRWFSIAVVYATLDETLQPLTHRTCSGMDWMADILGLTLPLLLIPLRFPDAAMPAAANQRRPARP